MFIPIDKRTLILENDGKWSFFYETEASIHLFQWGERVYGAQSLKERRLLCKSMFIPLERWTLILKIVERLENQGFNIIYPNEENAFMVANHENIRDYYLNSVYPNWWTNFDSKKWWEMRIVLRN